MKKHLNLTVDSMIVDNFRQVNGGSMSAFVEERMAEFVEKRRMQYWLICSDCKKKVHINVVLNNGGTCPIENCTGVIAEKIPDKPNRTNKLGGEEKWKP